MSSNSFTYTFYFEVNSFNVNNICDITSQSQSFTGYDLGQSGASSNFPISGTIEASEDSSTQMVDINSMKINLNGNILLKTFSSTVQTGGFMLWSDLQGQDSEFVMQCPGITSTGKDYQFPQLQSGYTDLQPQQPMYGYEHIGRWHCHKNVVQSCASTYNSSSNNFAYRNVGYSTYPNKEYHFLTSQYLKRSSKCQGKECSTWFPPNETIPISVQCYQTPSFLPGLNVECAELCDPCVNAHLLNAVLPCSNANPQKSSLMISGSPTFTFKSYLPNSYTSSPSIVNNTYQSLPSNTLKGFYNKAPFNTTIDTNKNPVLSVMDANTLTEQPSKVVKSNIIPNFGSRNETSQTNNTYTLPKNSYAIYSVTYTLSETDFTTELGYQILDLLYLQETLYNTFSTDFRNSCYWQSTTAYINQLILDYCNNSGNMSLPLCSKNYLPFSFLNKSPCSLNYSNCVEGWNNFCSQESNYNKDSCLNHYSNSYDGNNLNASTITNLINTCSNIYNSESDKDNLSSSFWDICGCYLPEDVYTEEASGTDNLTYDNRQCWYVPCLNSSILPSINPKCPDNDIINCIQRQYVTTENISSGQKTTTMTQSTIKNCNSAAVKDESTTYTITDESPTTNITDESPTTNITDEITTSNVTDEITTSNVTDEITTSNVTENFTFPKVKGNKKIWNIILFIIIILLLFIKCFWKK